MLDARGSEITQELSHVFVGQCATGLELDQQAVLDEEISMEFAQQRAVIVKDIQRVLLNHDD